MLAHSQFQYIKCTGQLSYGFWDRTWFAIQQGDRYIERNTRFLIDRNRDFIEVFEPDKIWVLTGYPDGREQAPKCRFYRYELGASVAEYTEDKITAKSLDFIAEKRAKSDTSVLFVRHSEIKSDIEYHLLVQTQTDLTVFGYKFNLNSE